MPAAENSYAVEILRIMDQQTNTVFMPSIKRVLVATTLLFLSHAASLILRFVRNVILARLILPADYGVAATFWLTTGFLATVTEFGVEQMLIRDKQGDSEEMAGVTQMILLIRGFFIGFLIFLLAGPFMALMGAPQASDSFRLLAISSALSGFVHRDTVRMQRTLRFGPSILLRLGPDVVVTILAWPIAVYFGDYRAFVCFAILQSALSVIASHMVAERPFRISWESTMIRRCISFGWPLMLNSILMFFALQGDRLVLANAYSQEVLGFYSIAGTIVLTLGGLLISIANQIILPILAKRQEDIELFVRNYQQLLSLLGCSAVAIVIFLTIFGRPLIQVIYGQRYGPASAVIGVLAMSQGIRLLRVGATTAALALGDSRNSLASNTIRLLAFPACVLVAMNGLSIFWIAIAVAISELGATLASALWMQWRNGLSSGPIAQISCVVIVAFGCSFFVVDFLGSSLLINALMFFAILVPSFVICLYPVGHDVVSLWRGIIDGDVARRILRPREI